MKTHNQRKSPFPRAVLFDLDGTLLDSAPDMHAAANRLRIVRGMSALPLQVLRPYVSKGGRAVVQVALPRLAPEQIDGLLPEFLALYREELGHHSRPFPGVDILLDVLEQAGVVWGIVSNKAEDLVRACVQHAGWMQRCAVLLGGDSLAQCKPHPLPLLHAAAHINQLPADCVYIGDDRRDIEAARAAGMPSVAALWGYRLEDDDPSTWNADTLVADPQRLAAGEGWPALSS